MPSPAATRKRSRTQLSGRDEVASSTKRAATLFTSAKKRKLNTYESSSGSDTRLGTLKRTIGGILGWGGKEKDNVIEDKDDGDGDGDEDEDEDEDDDELALDTKNMHPVKGRNNVWDIESSGPEDEQAMEKGRNNSGRTGTASLPKKHSIVSKNGSTKQNHDKTIADELTDDIWEVPGEETFTSRSRRKTASSVDRAKALLAPSVDDKTAEIPMKNSRGRPKRTQILKAEQKLLKRAARERMIAAALEEIDRDDEESIATPTTRRRNITEHRESSTGHKRGGQSSSSMNVVKSTIPVPKGVLTPTKNKIGRSRKSVVFDEMVGEVDLGFKDVPHSADERQLKTAHKFALNFMADTPNGNRSIISKFKRPAANSEELLVLEAKSSSDTEANSVETDEIACAVCLGLKSTNKNPIIICEGCEFSAHQKCYGISIVPEGDWFCRDCQPDAADDIASSLLLDASALMSHSFNLLNIEGLEEYLRSVQHALLGKLTGQKRVKLRGHDEEVQKVYRVLEQTVLAGEGNSMLVIGARGSGKTTLVEEIISSLSAHKEMFHVVRLNGFIHTDDKVALKEIWRQLGREMEVQDDFTGKTSNYADTMASLLALLSHPSDLPGSQPGLVAKSVIFLLDEFDIFTTHPRQTLLYNLFDIAQARKAPIAVLGLTTRIDVVESLEKRVKSRFSHRYVHLSLPRSLSVFWDICKEGLMVNKEDIKAHVSDYHASWDKFLLFWQTMIEDMYNNDAVFKRHVQLHFYRSKSVPAFFASCLLPVANISPRALPLTGKSFASTYLSLLAPDSKLETLRGLSELEIALLISAARLDVILDTDTCNFDMAYDEYSSLTSRHKIQISSSGVTALGASVKVWSRDVALGAWERLTGYELLVPAGIGGAGGREVGAGGRMWKVDIGLEEITGSVDTLSSVMAKWCREI